MKLLRCRICDELVRLRGESQSCQCGASKGRYLDDRDVEISGPCELYGVRSIDYFSGEDWSKKLFRIPHFHPTT